MSRSSSSAIEKASRLSSSPESSISLFPSWDANDLRLLHHYSTLTSGSLFLINRHGANRIVQIEVPRLAFEHEFLMHCVLGIASLHLQHLAPDVPEHQSLTLKYRVKALSGLRMTISQLSKETYRAVLAGSLFISILSSDLSAAETGGDLWIGNWLGLWAGMRKVIKVLSWTFVEQSGLKPIFAKDDNPHTTLANLPVALSDMLSSMNPDNEDTKVIFSTLGCLSKLYEYMLLNGFTPEFTTLVIAWPPNTSVAELAALAKRRQPQALIIAAYYLVFTKLVDEIWWMADISGREIETIANALPLEFQSLMIIPLQAVHLHSKWEILSLLLSQLPGGSSCEEDLQRVSKPQFGRELLPVEEYG
jgi:Fungal specific transcription factor domain